MVDFIRRTADVRIFPKEILDVTERISRLTVYRFAQFSSFTPICAKA